ncbi:MAG: site-specific DNA-methyltransferase [Acidobacteria bacterium]|nr:site-specific DNA-methyltransferase [Acidobacteriota bacterium]
MLQTELQEFIPELWRDAPIKQTTLPGLAKDNDALALIRDALARVPTQHRILHGNSQTTAVEPESVHLVVTSPPYWTLKDYPGATGQLGMLADYDSFLGGLDAVWRNCYHALVPGGRLVCVVGDVCLSRRRNGRHAVIPLHASIQERCREIGFDNLSPIFWHKIANARTESQASGSYLGKPYEPNGILKNDVEYILMLRKPGGYRQPSSAARVLSVISAENHGRWFRQIWSDIPGASTRNHPAPYPVDLAERLIRMFSFAADTVLDPFMGSGTTTLAAHLCGRNSMGIEIEKSYVRAAEQRLLSAGVAVLPR